VQVSTDNGVSWETVAIGKTTPDLAIDWNQFQNTQSLQVRVVATNGFKSSIVISQTLRSDDF
jgi:hypothetical protein